MDFPFQVLGRGGVTVSPFSANIWSSLVLMCSVSTSFVSFEVEPHKQNVFLQIAPDPVES